MEKRQINCQQQVQSLVMACSQEDTPASETAEIRFQKYGFKSGNHCDTNFSFQKFSQSCVSQMFCSLARGRTFQGGATAGG
jgi:hypothetical protein